MKIEGAWLAHQLHSCLYRKLISLTPVAGVAASHEIFPGRRASAGTGHDVIKSEFTGWQKLAAILAGVAIPQQNVLP